MEFLRSSLIDTLGRTRFMRSGYDTSEDIEAGVTHRIDDLLAGR